MPQGNSIPVVELIRRNLLDAVGLISTASGYNCNLTAFGEERLGTPVNDGETIAATVQLGEEDSQDLLCNGVIEKFQEFLIVATITQPEDAEEDVDELVQVVRSDIERAIRVDIFRGGYAHDTIQQPPLWFQRSEGQHEGVVVRCIVRYRTSIDDPYIPR